MKGRIEKIAGEVPEDQLKNNPKRYKRKALELGATRIEVISARDTIVEERVVMECGVLPGVSDTAYAPAVTHRTEQ